MKTILLATDFSENATLAAHFAAQLANDQKATLVLVHAYQAWPDNPAKTGDFPLSVNATRDISETELQKLAHELTKKHGAYIPIRFVALEGSAREVIQRETVIEEADLLIMSTVGTAPQSAQVLGSLATDMITQIAVPLLLIPPGRTYEGIKNVVLGIDLASPPNAFALSTVLDFTKAFGCALDVLCISNKLDDPNTQDQAEHIRHLLDQQHYSLTIEAQEGDIYNTLLTYAHTSKADLIMMLPQTRNWLDSLFTEGETKHLARLTDIPVLAVV
ncbi:universal stress protein [Fibrella forsythiae]|uniref:Universal stress protein n=1 Tax=Fibrella forsythiae TaxID=2817061 RepID=A0ABS3JCK4_9BACT|nr:universal stress protein [Fibrella forsythiae]MBO0947161.1 universal stress protein [Fibrella forsythiae]